jgi:two-component system response regulator YesN
MYRVLIVDDDRLARQGIISMMQWEKYGMIVAGEAQNGEKALEFLAKTSVDVLFVDLDMPIMNGISLMENSRALYPNLLFVVLTFHEDFHYAQTALRMGAIDYISKLQMESTDCNELLREISKKVEGIMKQTNIRSDTDGKNNSRDNQTANDFNEIEWEHLVGKWKQMYWLYDDITYEELCNRTKVLHIPIWRVAQVLLHLTSVAEENIVVVEKTIQEYKNLDDFFEWITSFRETLYKKASQETNFGKMQLCIMKAVIYVKEHLGTKMHVEEVAQIVNLSRSYFSVNFKKNTGMAFNEFVRQERVRAAQILLVEMDSLISDIAQKVSYEDVNYFIRVFCDLTGMTPGEYRKQNGRIHKS